jgi:GT2 family glycosyltransferase
MKDGWIHQGPDLGEIVHLPADSRRKSAARKSIAIIIPVKDEMDLLQSHLGLLSRQTTQDFDVIVVHKCAIDPKEVEVQKGRRKHGLIFLGEKAGADLGLTGAFYAGQKFAVGHGYGCIINADVDCLPVSDDLVEKLAEAVRKEKGTFFYPWLNGVDAPEFTTNWYGAMSDGFLRNSGFTYLPLFYGWDEFEFSSRIKGIGFRKRCLPGVSMNHDILKDPSEKAFSSQLYYIIRNGALMSFRYPGGLWLSLSTLSPLCFYESISSMATKVRMLSRVLHDIAGMRFTCAGWPEKPEILGGMPQDMDAFLQGDGLGAMFIIIPDHLGPERAQTLMRKLDANHAARRSLSIKMRNPVAEAFLISYEIASCSLRHDKVVMVSGSGICSFNPFCLMAKNYYVSNGRKVRTIFKDSGLIMRLLRPIACAISFAMTSGIFTALSIVTQLRLGKDAFAGYGMR